MIGHQLVAVADAHLGTSAADEEAFLAFLDRMPELGDTLLLAGDIYDFWFTYKRLIPRHCIRVTARLVELARRMPVLMVGGNHDRWGDQFWGNETGLTFHPRELRFAIGTRRIVAIHGDGLHSERTSTLTLNRLLDTRAVIAAFDLMPSAIGFHVARRLGHNPEYSAQHPEVVAEGVRRQAAWAEAFLLREPSVDTLIMGHTHRPAMHGVQASRWYINPGAWLSEHRYAVITESGARLESFS